MTKEKRTVTLSLRVSPSTHDAIQAHAKRMEISVSTLLSNIVDEALPQLTMIDRMGITAAMRWLRAHHPVVLLKGRLRRVIEP